MKIETVSASAWTRLIQESPQSSLFVAPFFLESSGGEIDYLTISTGRTPVMGAVVGHRASTAWLSRHSLVLSREEHLRALRGSTAHADRALALLGHVVDLDPPARRLSFHNSVRDLRAAQWALDERGLTPRWTLHYTGLVGHVPVKPRRTSLRRDLELAKDSPHLTVTATGTLQDLREAIEGSGLAEVKRDLDWIVSTTDALVGRGASIWVATDRRNIETKVVRVAVNWDRTTYLIFGAATGQAQSRQLLGPLLHQRIVEDAARRGCDVDLVGANSRARAEFKAGWMTDLVRYTELSWTGERAPEAFR